jgi:hypothetical protein
MKVFYLALDILCMKLISFQFNEGGCNHKHSQPIMDNVHVYVMKYWHHIWVLLTFECAHECNCT